MSARMRVAHLLDDLAFGGVSRALGIFEQPMLAAIAQSWVEPVDARAIFARHYQADVIVVHMPPNWRRLAWAASLRLRNPGAAIVWVEHSYTAAWEAAKVPAPARFRAMMGMGYGMADAVVCVSHGQAQWLAQAADRPDLRVIHPHAANPGLGDLAYPVMGQRLRIGAYGRFCEQKGFDDLIRAHRAGAMPGCDLLIGGFGEDEALLRALAGHDPSIRFVGRVQDVAGFLAQCDAVAVPSRWEAYGMVACEAREAGRPVLVAPVDGLPEQAAHGAGITVDFRNGAALADAVAWLRGQGAIMARAARASVAGCAQQREQAWARLLLELAPPRAWSARAA